MSKSFHLTPSTARLMTYLPLTLFLSMALPMHLAHYYPFPIFGMIVISLSTVLNTIFLIWTALSQAQASTEYRIRLPDDQDTTTSSGPSKRLLAWSDMFLGGLNLLCLLIEIGKTHVPRSGRITFSWFIVPFFINHVMYVYLLRSMALPEWAQYKKYLGRKICPHCAAAGTDTSGNVEVGISGAGRSSEDTERGVVVGDRQTRYRDEAATPEERESMTGAGASGSV